MSLETLLPPRSNDFLTAMNTTLVTDSSDRLQEYQDKKTMCLYNHRTNDTSLPTIQFQEHHSMELKSSAGHHSME